ncbi:MAG TPA: DUF1850 domain-containing protein [Casimicrobiaceae bacterium]
MRATLPASEFTLAWDHSVEKTRWEERYRIDGARLQLIEARIEGSGAGMDPPPDARMRDGWWIWQPTPAPLAALRLTLSPFTADYELCVRDRCRALRSVIADTHETTVVEMRACRAAR